MLQVKSIQKVEKRVYCLRKVELYRQFLIQHEKSNIVLSFLNIHGSCQTLELFLTYMQCIGEDEVY